MTRNNGFYSRRRVRNNGKNIGETVTYNNNVKSIMGIAIALGVGFVAGRMSVSPEVYKVEHNTLSEAYFDEPTYNWIPYTVQYGDTVSKIVNNYESNPNKANRIIDLIEEFNKINVNSIKVGQEIYLFGVPSSYLKNFGYSDDYNLFNPTIEMDMRIEFLAKVAETLKIYDGLYEDFIKRFAEAFNDIQDYKINSMTGDDGRLDDILDRLRVLCDEAEQYGYKLADNLRAIPLSEAEENNLTPRM